MTESGRPRGRVRRIKVHLDAAGVEVEWEDDHQAPVAAPGPVAQDSLPESVVAEPPAEETPTAGHYVCAPMVGTFYRAPEPGAPPFVSVGDIVEPGQQVGVLEAMKLMNGIEVEVHGRVVEILVPDATPVEYEQPLIALDPLAT